MSTYHLRLEAINLDAFVYDTNLVSTVRGGGLLLLGATRAVQTRFPDLQPITTGASAGLYAVEAPDDRAAAALRDDVQTFLRTDADLRHATFAVDVVPGDDFATSREALLALNRWRQWRQPTVAIPSSEGSGACRVDGVRPVSDEAIPRGSDKPRPASVSVYRRWRFGVEQKQAFYRQQADVEARFTVDFDELSHDPARGNLHGKLAVIYADGNHFGRIQRDECRTPEGQREFDVYVKGRRRAWLSAFLTAAQAPGSGFHTSEGALRVETLLWGGDELLLVVPAWKGWWTLGHFFEHVAGWSLFGRRLTHAAGLVFCHHNAPIRRIKALAEALAGSVKRQPGGRDDNRFAYQVLESFDHIAGDVDEFRGRRWQLPEELTLAGHDMRTVAQEVCALQAAEFPRSKLHAIAHKLAGARHDAERAQAREWIEATLASRPAARAPVEALRASFGGRDESAVTWLHVAELWDYLTVS
jgi:hypothetical protein